MSTVGNFLRIKNKLLIQKGEPNGYTKCKTEKIIHCMGFTTETTKVIINEHDNRGESIQTEKKKDQKRKRREEKANKRKTEQPMSVVKYQVV